MSTAVWHFIWLGFALFWLWVWWSGQRRYRYAPPRQLQTGVMPMPRSSNTILDLDGEVRGETERAWRFYDGRTTVWLPKSLCEWDAESKTMQVPEWLALNKGLI